MDDLVRISMAYRIVRPVAGDARLPCRREHADCGIQGRFYNGRGDAGCSNINQLIFGVTELTDDQRRNESGARRCASSSGRRKGSNRGGRGAARKPPVFMQARRCLRSGDREARCSEPTPCRTAEKELQAGTAVHCRLRLPTFARRPRELLNPA